MKTYRKIFAALFAAVFLTAAAFAADASPAGTWKWTQPGRNGGEGFAQTLKLEVKDGQLSGTMVGRETPRGQIPDVAISDASYRDGMVKFTVTREFGDRKFTQNYEGKLDGDSITGSVSMTGRDGEPIKRDWSAARVK